MFTINKRPLFLAAVALSAAGLVGLTAAMRGNESAKPRMDLTADILSPAVSAQALSEFLAHEATTRGFRPVGAPTALRPADGPVEYHATMALPSDQGPGTETAMASGLVIARIDVERDYARLGLSTGANYWWVDRKGPLDNPWRGIMISADGKTRNLLPGFRNTPNTEHSNPDGAIGHARQFCNGQEGCLFVNANGETTTWMRCDVGSCEVH